MPKINLSKLPAGLFHCPLSKVKELIPELVPIIQKAPIYPDEKYIVDAKIHMLMPNQWACIPNWHYDNIPRDKNNKQMMSKRDVNKKMFLYVSGEPLTEFIRAGGLPMSVPASTWIEFDQWDLHRGTMSKIHTWRLFIRLTPEPLLKPAKPSDWLRKHSQVYLDTSNFTW